MVPTLNDDLIDHARLFKLWANVNHDEMNIELDFSSCRFLRQNAVAFLGGLVRLVEYRSGSVIIDWNSMDKQVRRNLERNHFFVKIGGGYYARTESAIPYREDLELNPEELIPYLYLYWLGRGHIQLSEQLQQAIIGRVFEIYDNAFTHSSSPIGVMSCGQYYPKLQQLRLTVVDFGIGIPQSVRSFKGSSGMSDADALKWAFQEGTSTKPTIGRGMGLELLKEFVSINSGSLEVYSQHGYAAIGTDRERYFDKPSHFEGTLVNIALQCDARYYKFAAETADEPLF